VKGPLQLPHMFERGEWITGSGLTSVEDLRLNLTQKRVVGFSSAVPRGGNKELPGRPEGSTTTVRKTGLKKKGTGAQAPVF